MRLHPSKLFPPRHACYYLHGEDAEAIVDVAERLCQVGLQQDVSVLRFDIDELAQLISLLSTADMFSVRRYHVIIRDIASATPTQQKQLQRCIALAGKSLRLLICAPKIAWRKKLHQQLLKQDNIAVCEFRAANERDFSQWLAQELKARQLTLDAEVVAFITERLQGLRQASKSLLDRLELYANGEDDAIDVRTAHALMGESCPVSLADFCHAFAMREHQSLALLKRVRADLNHHDMQLLAWLGMRLQFLLLHHWYKAKRQLSSLKLFGDARKHVATEAGLWTAEELMLALIALAQLEVDLKGASKLPADLLWANFVLACLGSKESE